MNLSTTSVPGSRHPIRVPAIPPPPSSTSTESSQSQQPLSRQITPTTRIRRKPLITYHSLVAHEECGLRVEDFQRGISRTTQVLGKRTASESIEDSSRSNRRRMGPPLPLYHPLGSLALSLPELDPADFGLPNPIDIDDADGIHDGDPRRASSRARRPTAKLRERDPGDEEEAALVLADGLSGGQRRPADPLATRQASPRKRRAGGGKRRRKEVEDGDGTYPNPPKRARNPRVAAGTAIVSPAGAAEDEADASAALEELAAEQLEDKPTTRSRRKAPATKRRNSSASEATSTSASASNAANAANTRSTRAATAAKASEQKESATEPNASMGEENTSPGNVVDVAKAAPEQTVSRAPSAAPPVEVPMEVDPTELKKPAPSPAPLIQDRPPDEPADAAAPDVDMKSPQASSQDAPKPTPEPRLSNRDDMAAGTPETTQPRVEARRQTTPPPPSAPPKPASPPSVPTKSASSQRPPVAVVPAIPKSIPQTIPPVAPPPAIAAPVVTPKKVAPVEEKEEGELSEESTPPPKR